MLSRRGTGNAPAINDVRNPRRAEREHPAGSRPLSGNRTDGKIRKKRENRFPFTNEKARPDYRTRFLGYGPAEPASLVIP